MNWQLEGMARRGRPKKPCDDNITQNMENYELNKTEPKDGGEW